MLVEAGEFVALQAAGGVAGDAFVVVEFEGVTQQAGNRLSDLGNRHRGDGLFFPAALRASGTRSPAAKA